MRLQRKIIFELANKELKGFFSSPIAYLVLGSFIAHAFFNYLKERVSDIHAGGTNQYSRFFFLSTTYKDNGDK